MSWFETKLIYAFLIVLLGKNLKQNLNILKIEFDFFHIKFIEDNKNVLNYSLFQTLSDWLNEGFFFVEILRRHQANIGVR